MKKPLMTKVSMRHLNEIVRERNQYSRDAQEAWQDFINLKGRMDMDLSKVTKRNNFLVEELESWKQQVCSSYEICARDADAGHSSLNFKHLQSSSRKRLKILKSRLSRINVRTADSRPLLTSRKMMRHALLSASLAPRGSATTLWKLLSCNKRLQKS